MSNHSKFLKYIKERNAKFEQIVSPHAHERIISKEESNDWINLNPDIDDFFITLDEMQKEQLIKYLVQYYVTLIYIPNSKPIKNHDRGVEYFINSGDFLNNEYKKNNLYKPESLWRYRWYLIERLSKAKKHILSLSKKPKPNEWVEVDYLRKVIAQSFTIIKALLNNFASNWKRQQPQPEAPESELDYIRINDNKSIIFHIGIVCEALKCESLKNLLKVEKNNLSSLDFFCNIRNLIIHPKRWDSSNEKFNELINEGILKDVKKNINLRHPSDNFNLSEYSNPRYKYNIQQEKDNFKIILEKFQSDTEKNSFIIKNFCDNKSNEFDRNEKEIRDNISNTNKLLPNFHSRAETHLYNQKAKLKELKLNKSEFTKFQQNIQSENKNFQKSVEKSPFFIELLKFYFSEVMYPPEYNYYFDVHKNLELEQWKENNDFKSVITNWDFCQYFRFILTQNYDTKRDKTDDRASEDAHLNQSICWSFNTLLLLDWFTSFIINSDGLFKGQ